MYKATSVFRLLPLFVAQVFCSNLIGQHIMVLRPDSAKGKDAFLDQLNPNTNFGKHLNFISFNWTFNGTMGLGKSLIQFDISQIPVNKMITSAKLFLWHNPATISAGQAGNNACFLKRVTSPWDEKTVTWNSAPTTTSVGPIFLSTSTSSNQDYPDIDLTSIVKHWHQSPNENYGLMLELIDQSLYNSMKFCSSDCSDSTKRPTLIVTYYETTGIATLTDTQPVINIYPNPATDHLIVDFSKDVPEGSITIYDVNAQVRVKCEALNTRNIISIAGLPGGVYYAKVRTGTYSEVRKIVLN